MTTILIVEDMPDNAELAKKILTSRGFQVIHAPNAETGLQLAKDHLPDLILLDLGLPDYDGLTLAGWLRAEPEIATVPIVAFTAWPQETAKQMAESYGCDGYIGKPIENVNDFVARINSYLKSG
jgi:two-component system cell cycle response regulator DivK